MGYIEAPILDFWSVTPVGSGTSAHVAYSRASTCPTWAELLEPTGVTYQKSNMGASMYLIQLSFSQIYKKFCDIVVYPNGHYGA